MPVKTTNPAVTNNGTGCLGPEAMQELCSGQAIQEADSQLEATSERTNYYVYALAHPAFGMFYIGKGCGTRIYAHELSAIDSDSRDSEKNKVLQEISARGEKPIRYLVASDLTESEAFRIESVVMALCQELERTGLKPNLKNIAKGQGSAQVLLRDTAIDLMNAEPADFQGKRLLLISINREYSPFIDYSKALPDHVAGRWVLEPNKAQTCEYVLACSRGRIIGVYTANNWAEKPMPGDKRKRYAFSGKPANDSFAESILHKRLPDGFRFGSANPVAYFPR